MKKKFLALALCLILCLPFVLTSCFGNKEPDAPDAPALPELSTYELLGGKFEPAENYTSHTTTNVEGQYLSNDGVLIATTKAVVSDDENEITTTYRVYNLETGTVVYSVSITYSYYTFEYTSTYNEIDIDLDDNYFIVYKSNDEAEVAEIYSTNGSLLLSTDEENAYVYSTDLEFIKEPTFIFDDGLYKIEKTESGETATLVKDLEFASILSEDFDIVSLPSGGYIVICYDYYSREPDDYVYILNDAFDLVKSIKVYDTEFSQFDPDDIRNNLFILNNGNLVVQTVTELGDYLAIADAGIEYDCVSNGYCYNVDTFKINTTTGEKTAVETPYVFEYIASRHSIEAYDDEESFPFEFENIAVAMKIENKQIVPVSDSSYAYTIIDNDLNVIGTYNTIPDGYKYGDIISDGKYILKAEISTELYNADGTLVKNIGNARYNEKYIITSKAVYDHNLNLVYSLEDSELSTSYVGSNYITFYEQDKETGNYLYYRLSGTSTEPQLFLTKDSNTQLYWEGDYYYTVVYTPEDGETDAFCTVSVYTVDGTLITSQQTSEYANISDSTMNEYDYISIEDGDKLTIIVLK